MRLLPMSVVPSIRVIPMSFAWISTWSKPLRLWMPISYKAAAELNEKHCLTACDYLVPVANSLNRNCVVFFTVIIGSIKVNFCFYSSHLGKPPRKLITLANKPFLVRIYSTNHIVNAFAVKLNRVLLVLHDLLTSSMAITTWFTVREMLTTR